MELYDIVDAASSLLNEGTLVLHKSMKAHPTFKVYKKFCYDLYRVVDKIKGFFFITKRVKMLLLMTLLKYGLSVIKLT